MRARLVPSSLLLLLLAAPALAGERAAIVLADGQTIEGEAETFEGGEVEVVVDVGGVKQRLRLAASAIERIEPLASRAEETVREAVVRLADGRELRGEAVVRSSEVVVRGPHGQVVVPRADVRSIAPALPELPRAVVDADTGLTLPLPQGWVSDEPGGVGERLRLVRQDAAATLSVVLRPLPSGDGAGADEVERVRRALRHDVGSGARVERLHERRWRVLDQASDPAVAGGWPLFVAGVAELVEGHVVFFRLRADGAGALDPALPALVEELVTAQAWLRAGVSRDGGFFRDPALGLFLEAPPGFRVREGKEAGERARVVSPSDPASRLVVHVVDDPAPKDALLDLLEAPPEATDELPGERGGPSLVRVRGAKERGVALRAPAGGTVAVVARAPRPEPLADLTLGVLLIHPSAAAEALDAAERLLPLLGRAREALDGDDPAAALAALEPVLAELPDEPAALGLRAAALRAQGAAPEALLDALDAVYVAAGAPWVAQELARVLRERSAALAKAGDLRGAVESIERAAEVWPDEATVTAAVTVVVDAARRAHAAGEPLVAWARLARLRELVGAREAIDDAEAALRLASARAALQARDPAAARREARRAWALGAPAAEVEAIYAAAELLDQQRELARQAERARRGGGSGRGLEFGVPPTRSGRAGNVVRSTPFERRPNTTSRFVRPIREERGDRVRPRREGQGRRVRGRPTRQGSRVRSNGRLVFE